MMDKKVMIMRFFVFTLMNAKQAVIKRCGKYSCYFIALED